MMRRCFPSVTGLFADRYVSGPINRKSCIVAIGPEVISRRRYHFPFLLKEDDRSTTFCVEERTVNGDDRSGFAGSRACEKKSRVKMLNHSGNAVWIDPKDRYTLPRIKDAFEMVITPLDSRCDLLRAPRCAFNLNF